MCLFSNYLLDINPTIHTITPIANDIPTGIPSTLKPKGKSKRLKPTILAALLFSTINTCYNKIISNIILL